MTSNYFVTSKRRRTNKCLANSKTYGADGDSSDVGKYKKWICQKIIWKSEICRKYKLCYLTYATLSGDSLPRGNNGSATEAQSIRNK